jgi:hypothetical protein
LKKEFEKENGDSDSVVRYERRNNNKEKGLSP